MNPSTASFLPAVPSVRVALCAGLLFMLIGPSSASGQTPAVSPATPLLQPETLPVPTSPAAALAALRAAIGRGDAADVERLAAGFGPLLVSALNAPGSATSIAAVLRAIDTGSPQSAAAGARIANSVATLAATMVTGLGNTSARSAGTLAAAVSAVIARPNVIATAPGVVGKAASVAAEIASNADVIRANPGLVAQIASDTAVVAKNPAVLQATPAVSAAIAVSVSVIVSNPAVRVAAPELVRSAAADATAIIRNEAVTFSSPAIGFVEKNLGLTPRMSIDPSLNVSPSGG